MLHTHTHTHTHTQLPWKPVKSIVAYYYMWKTTDRYQIQKRHRMLEKQNDLKEVIVHLRTSTGAPAGPRDLSGTPQYMPFHAPIPSCYSPLPFTPFHLILYSI